MLLAVLCGAVWSCANGCFQYFIQSRLNWSGQRIIQWSNDELRKRLAAYCIENPAATYSTIDIVTLSVRMRFLSVWVFKGYSNFVLFWNTAKCKINPKNILAASYNLHESTTGWSAQFLLSRCSCHAILIWFHCISKFASVWFSVSFVNKVTVLL